MNTITVERSSRVDASEYAHLFEEAEHSLLYQSPEWLAYLRRVALGSEQVMFIAREDSRPVGGFVAFLKYGSHGMVLNALPYFGSHGDFLISQTATNPSAIVSALARSLTQLRQETDVKAVNIVAHPLSPHIDAVAATLGLQPWDRRIGQISFLRSAASREEALEATLSDCKQKTRNVVRKAIKRGFAIERSERDADWAALIEHHCRGIERIGGQAKGREEFAALRACFTDSSQRRLYVARRGGQFAGGLLCFFHKEWVEYFTPVAVEEYRNEQVLSALIVEALIEARLEGRRFWNWGGTWTSQAGVYHFKHGWGAVDHVYDYYGAADTSFASVTPSEIRAHYPFFYVRPFSSTPVAAGESEKKMVGFDGA